MATLLVLTGVVTSGCRGKAPEETVERVPRVRLADVEEVVPELSSRHLVLVQPWRRAELSPRYGGQISQLLVDDQDEVAEGDL
ncbi:MAG: hypothetical protein KC431_19410, partial [Myxococcales bacterium]|nr:hypothetical protein [Myxococcales bacterium]